jgi:hypothetical protein
LGVKTYNDKKTLVERKDRHKEDKKSKSVRSFASSEMLLLGSGEEKRFLGRGRGRKEKGGSNQPPPSPQVKALVS